jgi:nucleoside phosphorylase
VRLGDILVAEDGVVPYGHVRVEAEGDEIRRPAARPSVVLKAAARRLRIGEEGGSRPWERLLDVRGRPGLATYRRPPSTSDVLWADDGGTVGRHPDPVRSGHEDGLPKVHFGRLGSGAKLIRSAAERNRLARRHRLLGFDMEGDGVSDGAYLQGVDWFMVRGVSDYGAGKNDLWHRYAALAAAAYTHALLGQVEPLATPPGPAVGAVPGDGLVAALLDVRSMRDGSSRDRVIASLPEQYRNGLPRSRSAYEDVAGLVRALGRQPGGLEALRQVLQDLEQDSRPVRRFAGLIRPDDRSNN